jgi:small-conductance mechanosensitive channel
MKQDIYVYLENLLSEVMEFAPRLLMALVTILIGYLLGRVVASAIKRLILYLNRRANQGLRGATLNIDLRSSATFISSTFFWIIISVAILVCIRILGLEFSGFWLDQIIAYIPNIVAAVIIIFVGIIAGRLLGELVRKTASRTGGFNGKHLSVLVRYLTLFVAAIVAVDQIGVDIVFLEDLLLIVLAALLFGASFSFGLGAKTSVSNILGSYYFRKTHQLGTRIRFGDIEGTVVKISDHAVSLETNAGLVVVPAKRFNENDVIVVRIDENE